jgi:ABC-2 type transport system permease protein/sodium transport system permease protein
MAVTPLVNIVMLARDVLEGDVESFLAAAAILSTGLYVVAAIAVAARIFGTDAVLYGSPSSWADVLRRPAERQSTVSPAAAMFTLALMFPCYFVAAGSLAQLSDYTLAQRMASSGMVTALVFAVIPAAIALFYRVWPGSGLGLRMPRPAALAAAVLFGLALWPFAHEIFLLNQWLGIGNQGGERFAVAHLFADQLRTLPLALLLITLAIAPGVCEEFFFRGLLFGALRRTLSAWSTIAATAVLFGLFHVVVGNVFLPERFLPSAFLGLVLGWVRWRTGSVVPTMIMHSVHNGILLCLTYWQPALLERGIGVDEQSHLPLVWIGTAACVATAGAWVVRRAGACPHESLGPTG